MIDVNLSWIPHIECISKKIKQHVYFLHRPFGASRQIICFFKSVPLSVMLYCSTAWLSSLSVKIKTKLYNRLKVWAKIIGQPVAHLF